MHSRPARFRRILSPSHRRVPCRLCKGQGAHARTRLPPRQRPGSPPVAPAAVGTVPAPRTSPLLPGQPDPSGSRGPVLRAARFPSGRAPVRRHPSPNRVAYGAPGADPAPRADRADSGGAGAWGGQSPARPPSSAALIATNRCGAAPHRSRQPRGGSANPCGRAPDGLDPERRGLPSPRPAAGLARGAGLGRR